MSGRSGDDGQLALMDALVFFIAATVVSGVLFSTLRDGGEGDRVEPGWWFDASKTLDAILGASLGSEVQVTVHGEKLMLPERAEIAECLLLQAHVIAVGDGLHDFCELDMKLYGVLRAVCGQSVESHLSVLQLCNGVPTELFSIPGDWDERPFTCAATSELVGSDDNTYLAQLRSAPTAGLEPP